METDDGTLCLEDFSSAEKMDLIENFGDLYITGESPSIGVSINRATTVVLTHNESITARGLAEEVFNILKAREVGIFHITRGLSLGLWVATSGFLAYAEYILKESYVHPAITLSITAFILVLILRFYKCRRVVYFNRKEERESAFLRKHSVIILILIALSTLIVSAWGVITA